MADDVSELKALNEEIGRAETRGDRGWLEGVIGPQLAFRRANGTVVDRQAFLDNVKKSDERETRVESVEVCGERAVVRCTVTMKTAEGSRDFHNLRLFVRQEDGWKVIGWANEAV